MIIFDDTILKNKSRMLSVAVMNVALTGVRTCLWVQRSRSESSWQLLTAVLLLVCWKDKNVKSLEKVLRIQGSVRSPEFPEFFWNGFEKSGLWSYNIE